MPYRLIYAPEAQSHLRGLTASQRAMVIETVEEQLLHQPTSRTRNRKPMRHNFLADWELRVRNLRVYYLVNEEPEPAVYIGRLASRCAIASLLAARRPISMRKVDLTEAATFLATYVPDPSLEPVVLMRGKKPVAVVVPVGDADLETISLCYSPKFHEILKRSQRSLEREGGISSEEIRREFGLPPAPPPDAKAYGGKGKARSTRPKTTTRQTKAKR